MPEDEKTPISVRQAKSLFADLSRASGLVLAVSGGPDSVALMWLVARWRKALSRGPRLLVVTVDHGLRRESAREAREVKRLARELDVPHRTLRWSDEKPKSGIPAAARSARYRLLASAARKSGFSHVVTAHTRDDQAETLLMRLLRGSGIGGLAAMARNSEREGVVIARPLLNVSKAQLVATLNKAGIDYADDPTNRDSRFARPRIRTVIEGLASEGGDARNLARLASRLARANAAIEVLADGAAHYLALCDQAGGSQPKTAASRQSASFQATAFAGLPEEIRLRLLMRAIDRIGHEGPTELGKAEALLAVLDHALAQPVPKSTVAARQPRLKQTLAGAVVSFKSGRITIEAAPPRRHRSN